MIKSEFAMWCMVYLCLCLVKQFKMWKIARRLHLFFIIISPRTNIMLISVESMHYLDCFVLLLWYTVRKVFSISHNVQYVSIIIINAPQPSTLIQFEFRMNAEYIKYKCTLCYCYDLFIIVIEIWSPPFLSLLLLLQFLLVARFVFIFHRFIADTNCVMRVDWENKNDSVKRIVRILKGSNARNSLTTWILNTEYLTKWF